MDKLKTESQKLIDELTNFEIKFNAEVERSTEFETKVKEQEAQLEINYNQQVLFQAELNKQRDKMDVV